IAQFKTIIFFIKKHINLHFIVYFQVFNIQIITQIIKCRYHILNIWFCIKGLFFIMFYVINMSLMVVLVEFYFNILGMTTFINISDKLIRHIQFFIKITLVPILHCKKPTNGSSCPALAYYMVNGFVFI